MKKTKSEGQRHHFKYRIKERFGLDVNRDDMNNMILQIKNGNSIPLQKQSNRVSIHSVWIKNIWVPVVYDRYRSTLVTALMEEWINDRNNIQI